MNESNNQNLIGIITAYDKDGNKLFECPNSIVSFTVPKTEREIKRDYFYAKFTKHEAIRNRTKSKRIKKKSLKLVCKYYNEYRKYKIWNYGGFNMSGGF